MKYEYIIDLNGKAVPQELIRKGNENIWPREIEEAEINGAMNKILNGLEGMGIQLRK